LRKERAADMAARRAAGGKGSADAVEDLVQCKACGDFVPAQGTRSCGRADCPYPG
jgi:hypothetical protein